MIWRVSAVVFAALLAACGGATEAPERQAVVASAGSAGSGVSGASGGPVAAPAAGREEAGVAGAPTEEPAASGSAGAVTVSVAGAPSAGAASGGSSGAAGGSAGSGGSAGQSSSAAGAGGAYVKPDPDCKPSQHALPLKCMPPQPIDCRLPEPGGDSACTGGYGACPSSNPSGQYCHPLEDKDYSLCPPFDDSPTFSALLKSCPKGTCGTDAGFACDQTTVVDGKYIKCPCVAFGSVSPNP